MTKGNRTPLKYMGKAALFSVALAVSLLSAAPLRAQMMIMEGYTAAAERFILAFDGSPAAQSLALGLLHEEQALASGNVGPVSADTMELGLPGTSATRPIQTPRSARDSTARPAPVARKTPPQEFRVAVLQVVLDKRNVVLDKRDGSGFVSRAFDRVYAAAESLKLLSGRQLALLHDSVQKARNHEKLLRQREIAAMTGQRGDATADALTAQTREHELTTVTIPGSPRPDLLRETAAEKDRALTRNHLYPAGDPEGDVAGPKGRHDQPTQVTPVDHSSLDEDDEHQRPPILDLRDPKWRLPRTLPATPSERTVPDRLVSHEDRLTTEVRTQELRRPTPDEDALTDVFESKPQPLASTVEPGDAGANRPRLILRRKSPAKPARHGG